MKPRKEILLTALLVGLLPNLLQSSDVMTQGEIMRTIDENGITEFLSEIERVLNDKNIDVDDLIEADWPVELSHDFISCRNDNFANKGDLKDGFINAVNDCIYRKDKLKEMSLEQVKKPIGYSTKL